MRFSFAITISCSCSLQVRPTRHENTVDAQLNVGFGHEITSTGSRAVADLNQREILKSDQGSFISTFSGAASIGTSAVSCTPSGGYIAMVLMEDLDPKDGTVVRSTISMIAIEDMVVPTNTTPIFGMKRETAVPTVYAEKECIAAASINRWWRALVVRGCLLHNALDVVRKAQVLDEVVPAIDIIHSRTTTTPGCCAMCLKTPILISMYNLVVRASSHSTNLPLLYAVLGVYTTLTHYRRLKKRHSNPPLRTPKQIAAQRQLDLLWMEMLVDVMVMLSAELQHGPGWSWLVFTAVANALWNVIMLLRPLAAGSNRECWGRTQQRLGELQHRIREGILPNPQTNGSSSPRGQFMALLSRILAHLSQLID